MLNTKTKTPRGFTAQGTNGEYTLNHEGLLNRCPN